MPEGVNWVTPPFANNESYKSKSKLAHWPFMMVYKPDGTNVACKIDASKNNVYDVMRGSDMCAVFKAYM